MSIHVEFTLHHPTRDVLDAASADGAHDARRVRARGCRAPVTGSMVETEDLVASLALEGKLHTQARRGEGGATT